MDLHPGTPTRLFTAVEANRMLPALESIFRRMDPMLARLRELQDLLDDYESYWGANLERAAGPERDAYLRIVAETEEVRRELDACVQAFRDAGAELKDPHLGLVDFYATMEGRLAFLCWRRGEPRVGHWHTLEAGFAGRSPIPEPPNTEP